MSMKKNFVSIALLMFFVNSVTTFAALDQNTLLQWTLDELINPLYKLATACAFIYFLYGGLRYVYELRNPDERSNGKRHLLWGTVGLFIIFSAGAIINFFGSLFGPLGGN